MNTTIIITGSVCFLAILFLVMQGLLRLYNSSSRKVYNVLAGPDEDHVIQRSKTEFLRPFESFRFKGKRIDPSAFILARVEGECMLPRGIHSGNIVFIHKMADEEKSTISDGSVLYIRSVKNGVENFYLREYIAASSKDDVVATRYYRNGYEPKDSMHHTKDEVIGTVRYCFE